MDVNSPILVDELSLEETSKGDDTDHTSPILDNIQLTTSLKEYIIFLATLSSISALQTLKTNGCIKHHPLVVLIDSDSTHNFINRSKVVVVFCFIHSINNFYILIANRGMTKCGGHCDNVNLQMGITTWTLTCFP